MYLSGKKLNKNIGSQEKKYIDIEKTEKKAEKNTLSNKQEKNLITDIQFITTFMNNSFVQSLLKLQMSMD